MRVIDPGHKYALLCLDGRGEETLTFVKREGPTFPGNVGSYPGTNIQEVLRVLIDRIEYLNGQIAAPENDVVVGHLRSSIRLLEERAARRHKRMPDWRMYENSGNTNTSIEYLVPCLQCGHIHAALFCATAH